MSRHVSFSGYPISDRAYCLTKRRHFTKQRAKLLAELAAMDQAAQAPPTGEFAEPSEPIEYPRCRYCGRRMMGACPMAECAAKAVDARYARFDAEAEEIELGLCERSQHGGLTLVVPAEQAWGRIGDG